MDRVPAFGVGLVCEKRELPKSQVRILPGSLFKIIKLYNDMINIRDLINPNHIFELFLPSLISNHSNHKEFVSVEVANLLLPLDTCLLKKLEVQFGLNSRFILVVQFIS